MNGRFAVLTCLVVMMAAALPLRAAELTVFSDGPLQTALVKIVADFQADTGHKVDVVYGTAPALKAKLAAGERADVLISLAPEIEEMKRHNQFTATEAGIASVKLGLAVRSGALPPDIATLDQFRQAILNADSIIHNSLASGLAFARQIERFGIAEQVRSKLVVVPGNAQFTELLKRSGNDLAAGPLTQIVANDKLRLAGVLPPQVQSETVYSAGAFADAKALDASRALVAFLASPKAAAAFAAAGAK
jgi:molybdate transport system substrate-binding protein